MKLKNVLLVTDHIEKSTDFYRELFGLDVILNGDGNVILTEGLVLQDKTVWEAAVGKQVSYKNHAAELYFEEPDLEAFQEKLDRSSFEIQYITRLQVSPWGRKVIRIYDLDHHVIEIGESPASPSAREHSLL